MVKGKRKKRDYVRASDGKFAVVRGSKSGVSKSNTRPKKTTSSSSSESKSRPKTKGGPSVAPRARSQRSIAKQVANARGNNKIGKVSNRAIRRERNQMALDALRKKGVRIPKGSITKIAQLRKGEQVRLANGTILKRSSDNKYTVVKPKKKKRGGFTRRG